jgi:hypothetical protein
MMWDKDVKYTWKYLKKNYLNNMKEFKYEINYTWLWYKVVP